MFEVIFLICLALVWIVFASVSDLKTREVPDWLNFSLIIFALGFRFFYGLFSDLGFEFFYQGLIGLGIFFILGNLFYYGRLFAGGDAKLMIALGAVLPFSLSFGVNLKIFASFFFIFLFVGAVYGFVFSIVLGLKNFSGFKKEFSKNLRKNKKLVYFVFIVGLIFMLLGFYESLIFYFGVLIFVLPYFYLYAKSVEEMCMVKKVNAKNLTEGDWLYEDLKIGNKVVKKDWNGLDKSQISLIRKYYKSVKIKQGIPFVPVFLISFVILVWLYLGNSYWEFILSFFGL